MSSEVSFITLTTANIDAWRPFIEETESQFPLANRWDWDDFLEMLDDISLIALIAGRPVGYLFAGVPLEEEREECGMPDGEGIYLYDIAVSPAEQGKGVGKALMAELVRVARERGFARILGHYRDGASRGLAARFGAREIRLFENWDDTGETYALAEIRL